MLTGRHAFMQDLPKDLPKDQNGAKSMYQATLKGCPAIPEGINVSGPCLDLLKHLLTPEPQQRVTIEGIMSHPWFTQGLDPSIRDLNLQYATQQQQQQQQGGQSELEIAAVVDAALAAARAKRQQQFRGGGGGGSGAQVMVADPGYAARR